MLHRQINGKVKEIKSFILDLVHNYIEPTIWDEFAASLNIDGRENYHILDDDLPDIRDLKALINMLTAIERATESYSLIALSVFKKIELPQDMWDFRRNYKIYMSTNGVFSQYLSLIKEFSIVTILPILTTKFNELLLLCTSANFEKASEFLIEQVIYLEQYQEKYLESKRNPDENKEPRDGFFSVFSKKNDSLLRKIYGDKYETHFQSDPKEDSQGYYPAKNLDSDTVKHLKYFSNGIIGIKKALDDYDAYKIGGLSGVSWIPTFVKDVRQAVLFLQEFDYQAILAEQANPIAEQVKNQLATLADSFQKLACIADHFEGAYCIKEGTLLQHVDFLIQRYNHITSELKTPVDYANQKRTYFKARIQAREQHLLVIDTKLYELNNFRQYEDCALSDIPPAVLCAMQSYITQYNGSICMDRNHLAQYEKYLAEALKTSNISMIVKIKKQIEIMANRAGFTLHAEMMAVLRKQQLYLEKQKIFLQNRLEKAREKYASEPYENFKLNEIAEDANKVILNKLKNYIVELNHEKNNLVNLIVPDEKKSDEDKSIPKKVSERINNQMLSRIKEHGLFSSAIEQYEETNTVTALQALVESVCHETSLCPKSLVLLDEIKDIATKLAAKQVDEKQTPSTDSVPSSILQL